MSFYEGPPFKFRQHPAQARQLRQLRAVLPRRRQVRQGVGSGWRVGVVYDGRTGAPIAELPAGVEREPAANLVAMSDTVYACAWSPTPAKLLTAGADKTCKLWAVPRLDPQGDAPTTPSPAGRRLCPGSRSSRTARSVIDWDFATWGARSSRAQRSRSRGT